MYPNQPQPSPQGAAPAGQFVDPTVGGGDAVKIRDLVGRTVICIPTSFDPAAPKMGKPGETVEQVIFDVMIVDGGELRYGSNATTGQPDTHAVATPFMARGIFTTHVNIVRALKPHVGKGVLVLGRIGRGITDKPGQAAPWNLTVLEPGDPARQLAAQIWSQFTLGQFVNPEPRELVPPSTGSTVPTSVYPGQPAPAYAAAGNGALPMPAGWSPQQWASMPDDVKRQIIASLPPAAAPAGPPPGWTPERWAQVPDGVKQQILATSTNIPTGY